jgi:hypothetical protein
VTVEDGEEDGGEGGQVGGPGEEDGRQGQHEGRQVGARWPPRLADKVTGRDKKKKAIKRVAAGAAVAATRRWPSPVS